MSGAYEVVRELSERYTLAIVTSCKKRHFDIIHRDTKLLPYFKLVLTREDYTRSKPDPDPYNSACAYLNLEKKTA